MVSRVRTKNATIELAPRSASEDLGFGPLTRLNFFDGFLLRASHLEIEQGYGRALAHLAARAQGWGIVEGFDASSKGDAIAIGAGFAIDHDGRPLLLRRPATVDVDELLATRSTSEHEAVGVEIAADFERCDRKDRGPDAPASRDGLYRLCIGASERLCGQEDVMGALCDNACVKDWERPYIVEGVRAWLEPVEVSTAKSNAESLGVAHERSLVASAYFVAERARGGHLISAAGLASTTWCHGARAQTGGCVPLAIVSIRGRRVAFLDQWTARREHIEMPPKHYWALATRMRPYNLFLAEVLQFQCQLAGLLTTDDGGGANDPCAEERSLLAEARRWLADARTEYQRVVENRGRADALRMPGGLTKIDELERRIDGALLHRGAGRRRLLVDGGIVELPPAGYLPVDPTSAISVNEQVRRWMGEGVDLRFCRVRHDYVQHAFEEAQHMDRISLLQGLDDPSRRPEVDILVPDGEILRGGKDRTGAGFGVAALLLVDFPRGVQIQPHLPVEQLRKLARNSVASRGAARGVRTTEGGVRFVYAGAASRTEVQVGPNDGVAPLPAPAVRGRTMPLVLAELDNAVVGLAHAVHAVRSAAPPAPPVTTSKSARAERIQAVMKAAAATIGDRQNIPSAGAAFVEASADHDPLELEVSQRSRINVRALFGQPIRQFEIVELDLAAEATATQVTRGSAATRIAGTLRVWGTQEQHSGDGGHESNAFSETLAFELNAVPSRNEARIDASLDLSDVQRIQFTVLVSKSGPTTWTVRLLIVERTENAQTPVAFFETQLEHDDAALREGSAPRALASQAISLLEGVLPEPGFGDAARAFLFGGANEAVGDDLVLRATRDWVLFHRRRIIECAGTAAPVLERPDRRYQIFHITEQRAARLLGGAGDAPPDDIVAALRAAFVDGADVLAALRKAATPVAVAAYRDRSAQLTTNAATLTGDLASAGALDEIVFAVVASDGDVDGESLERQRMLELHVATSAASQRSADIHELWLEDVPLAFVSPETPGFQLLVTRAVARVECQSVFAISEVAFKRLEIAGIVKDRDAAALEDALARVDRIATAEFDEGTSVLRTPVPALTNAWAQFDPDNTIQRLRAVTLTRAEATSARSKDQAIAVEAALRGAQADDYDVASAVFGDALPGGCPSLHFILVGEPREPVAPEPNVREPVVVRVLRRAGDDRDDRLSANRPLGPDLVEAEIRVEADGLVRRADEAREVLTRIRTPNSTGARLVIPKDAPLPSMRVRDALLAELRATNVVPASMTELRVVTVDEIPDDLIEGANALLVLD